jgi:putative transcriptional regulator
MIQHHPGDEFLLPLASGRLDGAQSLLVDVHLEYCASCRSRLRPLLAVGGALLEEAEPATLRADAWAHTLARIEDPAPAPTTTANTPVARAAPPPGASWPAALRRCDITGWRWMGPGMRFARVTSPRDPSAALFLLRIGAGRSLPRHTHGRLELTQVLCGAFDDGRATFAAGDFDSADEQVHHQPVVRDGQECVCLAYVDGSLRFDGRIASVVGGWVGL